MTNVPPFRSALTVNRTFMQEFIAADPPCFALGMVEERQRPYSFLALRPDQAIPADVADRGFNFGHALLGNAPTRSSTLRSPSMVPDLQRVG